MTYKADFALTYFPDSQPEVAMHHLNRWIKSCPELVEALAKTGYRRSQHHFTKRQRELIAEYLGEP